jgi:HSP20 family protein
LSIYPNPYDIFNRFFRNRKLENRNFFDISEDFDNMRREMQQMMDDFADLQNNAPKELIREYETQDGEKVREVGPIVYGYSMTIGPEGRPNIREFGNIRSTYNTNNTVWKKGRASTQLTAEREPLADIGIAENQLKITLEMPGVKKENIKINITGNMLEISSDDPLRKYYKKLELPREADTNTENIRSTYNNGILEIIFNKINKEHKPKGKTIKID